MLVLNITENLHLKQLNTGDAPELFSLIESCRSYLRRWIKRMDQLQTLEDAEVFIDWAYAEASAYKMLQMGVRSEGELAGVVSFEKIDWMNQSAELGAWLGEGFQKRGIMTKATQRLIDYAFQTLRLNRVEIRCGTGNLKSQAIPERLGFQKEGIIREAEKHDDHFIDHLIYGMTRKDYQHAKGDRK